MHHPATLAHLSKLAATLLVAACSDAVSPLQGPAIPTFSHVGSEGIALDQYNGSLGESGMVLLKGFNPTNPHRGSAIVATFFWIGSSNVITEVTDHLTDGTPVGNAYTLVEYISAGGVSMATYVATDIQNFPDPNPTQETVLVVRAILSQPIADGGVMLSAYSGVNPVLAQALGAHRAAAGSGSETTVAGPGAIPAGAGALVYGVTMASATRGYAPPAGFTNISTMSDFVMKADGEYSVRDSAGPVDPRWTWFFDTPSTWLATVLALNPATAQAPLATRLEFSLQPSATPPFVSIQPAVSVTAVDDQGNPDRTFTGLVTIAIGRNGGSLSPGTLSGTTTVVAVNGVATFSDLSIDQPGSGYTLVVTTPGLIGAESAPFSIGAF